MKTTIFIEGPGPKGRLGRMTSVRPVLVLEDVEVTRVDQAVGSVYIVIKPPEGETVDDVLVRSRGRSHRET